MKCPLCEETVKHSIQHYVSGQWSCIGRVSINDLAKRLKRAKRALEKGNKK
jgi:hypothetical protein